MIADPIQTLEHDLPAPKRGEPAWPVALLFPWQGDWTEEDYLALETDRLVELSDGCLEVLPMPSAGHQWILQFLFKLLESHVLARDLGYVFTAGLPIRLWPQKMRQPDVVYLRPEQLPDHKKHADGAELVIEVLSDGTQNRDRDLSVKWREYAKAGIREYWTVDLDNKTLSAFVLDGKQYRRQGDFGPGQTFISTVLPGLEVHVGDVFAAAMGPLPSRKKMPRKKDSKPKSKTKRGD